MALVNQETGGLRLRALGKQQSRAGIQDHCFAWIVFIWKSFIDLWQVMLACVCESDSDCF